MEHPITIQDVKNVAASLKKELSEELCGKIACDYSQARLGNPDDPWYIIVEDMIYHYCENK